MSQINESITKSNESKEETNNESRQNFYDLELDGLAPDPLNTRGVKVAEFGIAADLNDISVNRRADEFEAVADSVTRNIAALDPVDISLKSAALSEFDTKGSGASFLPSEHMFSQQEPSVSRDVAPPLPFFLEPARTSFRSPNELSKLRAELENTFSACSISFVVLENECGYSCSALRQLTVIGIEVHIFGDEGGELLVELRQISGCRYAYGEVTELIAQTLGVTFSGSAPCLPQCPPDLSDEDLLALPELKRALSCEVKCNEEVCTCEYALQLVTEEVPRATLLQGLRAIGALVDTLACAMNSCSHCGECGAHHYNHEKLFAKGGHWVRLAARVGELAKSDDEEVRSVAMAAVANIATLQQVCGKWLEGTIPTLVAGANDDAPHVRREALRSIEAVAKDEKMAAKLVRAGVVPALELEASGGEDNQSPDMAMQTFAEGALIACRG